MAKTTVLDAVLICVFLTIGLSLAVAAFRYMVMEVKDRMAREEAEGRGRSSASGEKTQGGSGSESSLLTPNSQKQASHVGGGEGDLAIVTTGYGTTGDGASAVQMNNDDASGSSAGIQLVE